MVAYDHHRLARPPPTPIASGTSPACAAPSDRNGRLPPHGRAGVRAAGEGAPVASAGMSDGAGQRAGAGRLVGVAVTAVLVLAVTACGGDDGDDDASPTTTDDPAASSTETAEAPDGPTAADLCEDATRVDSDVRVADTELTEVSGIATSRRNPGVLWAHNDSGGGPDVYAVGEDGGDLGRFRLGGDATAVDWEDMTVGPGPQEGVDHLYLGDIGDNRSQRDGVVVYRVAEPEVDVAAATAGPPADVTIDAVDTLSLTYPDGAHDAETLLSDPVSGDVLVVSKQWDGVASGVYRIPADAAPGAPIVMERVGEVPGVEGQMVTSGDIAPDGSLVALRTYAHVLVWDRGPGQSVAEALSAGEPCEAPPPSEIQGEALAFSADGEGYVTVAEGNVPALNRFHL